MQVSWSGAAVFGGFCVLLSAALSRPEWSPLAEAGATVLILLGIAGVLEPRLKKPHRS
jgi:hypothetical protein